MTKFSDANIVVTGSSGAIGPTMLGEINSRFVGFKKIYCIFRSQKSYEKLERAINEDLLKKIVPVYCDITDAEDCRQAFQAVKSNLQCIVLHMAADVSWNKPYDQIEPTNVTGALNIANCARETADTTSFILFSTAFAIPDAECDRNTYETSKLECEKKLTESLPHNSLFVLAPSSIMGHSKSGSINKFNSVYPLIWLTGKGFFSKLPRYIAEYEVDCVPVDWVARESIDLVEEILSQKEVSYRRKVLSVGQSSRIPLKSILDHALSAVNRLRENHGLSLLPTIEVIEVKKGEDWTKDGSEASDLMFSGYNGQSASSAILEPENCRTVAPDPRQYIEKSIGYWLSKNEKKMLRTRP